MNQKYKRPISLLAISWHAPSREAASARLPLFENNTDWFDYNT